MGTNRNYLFISDLHLSEGRSPLTGKTSPTEDFFQDEAFAHFIVYQVNQSLSLTNPACYRRPWTLVVNGDLFDFLQVASLPAEGLELQQATGKATYKELSKNEQRYGLGTTERETVWKLGRIHQGHPLFFQALAWFLAHPNHELVIMKGNHDVELFWPGVQKALRAQLQAAYSAWRAQASQGCPPLSPLPLHNRLLTSLDDLETRVLFPEWFLHEPGLFFAEHGNQYDPFNDFDDFLKPILPSDQNLPEAQQRINAPAGSLVVRYFFNKLEQVHPFADNLKPLTRYLNYALNKDLGTTLRIGLSTPTTLPRTIWNLLRKRWRDSFGAEAQARRQIKAAARPAVPHSGAPGKVLADSLRAIQRNFGRRSWRTIALSIGSIVITLLLRLGMIALLFLSIRPLLTEQYGLFFLRLAAAGLLWLLRAAFSSAADNLGEAISLRRAAEEVCQLLNQSAMNGRPAGVRYHLYGHDHHADLVEIGDKAAGQPRQWYVNTGCWLPTLSEYDRLTRGEVQLTFFRIIPDLDDTDDGLPALMQWQAEVNEPRPLRLFDGKR
ncbi:MAG: hypothetical protein AB1791_13175 [Chloroflexota bacterium]